MFCSELGLFGPSVDPCRLLPAESEPKSAKWSLLAYVLETLRLHSLVESVADPSHFSQYGGDIEMSTNLLQGEPELAAADLNLKLSTLGGAAVSIPP